LFLLLSDVPVFVYTLQMEEHPDRPAAAKRERQIEVRLTVWLLRAAAMFNRLS